MGYEERTKKVNLQYKPIAYSLNIQNIPESDILHKCLIQGYSRVNIHDLDCMEK